VATDRGGDARRLSQGPGEALSGAMARPLTKMTVTGGAGFIGSAVVRLLLDSGYEVDVVDYLSLGYRHLVDDRARLFESSLAGDEWDDALDGSIAVMHLAASSVIKFSYTDPLGYVENNVVNGYRLVDKMRRHGVLQMIFSSSASAYGEPISVPIPESAQTDPNQIYGATKLACETLLRASWHAFGLNSASLRYFNAYGPGDLHQPQRARCPCGSRLRSRINRSRCIGPGGSTAIMFMSTTLPGRTRWRWAGQDARSSMSAQATR